MLSRHHAVRGLVVSAVLLAAAPHAGAASYAIRSVFKGDNASSLVVNLVHPLPPEQALVCASGQTCPWSVVLVDKKAVQTLIRVEVATTTADFSLSHQVFLQLATPIPAEYESVTVTLLMAKAPSRLLQTREAKNAAVLEPVDDPDDATLYFSGIVAPAAGGATTYTIDTHAAYILSRWGATSVSVEGEVKTDKRKKVDPDSVRLFANVTSRGMPYTGHVEAGAEFARDGSVFNLMLAPRMIRTFAHSFLQDVRDDNGNIVRMLRGTVGADAELSFELGANLQHPDTIDPSRLVARFVPRGKAYVIVPAPFVKKVVFSADYIARILARSEVFLETRGLAPDADPIAIADKRVRHHIEAAATASITDWVGLKLSYEYGSLPPSFNFVNHSGKVTLVFQAKQNER